MLMWLAQPLLRRKMAKRALQEPGYGEAVDERFGRYTHPVETTSDLVWLHAVSLGETRTAVILIKALRAQHPKLRLLLTHGTATGRAEGKALLRPGDVQVWQPWDTQGVVERFLKHFKPRLGLLMETEVWPCMVSCARAHGVPMLLINGRLSDKTLKQALNLSPLAYPAYGALAAVYAQTTADAMRYQQLRIEAAGVFGNIKFDATPNPSLQATGKAWRKALAQPVVMFASSREGEEALFLQAIKAADHKIHARSAIDSGADRLIKIKYLIVPRHPQRFDEVAKLASQHGLKLSRRSSWLGSPFESAQAMQADIWLGDTLGEMPLYYALSDVALLGGSFEKLGGQNLIEAAACCCPVVMGPHTFNFSEAAELAEAAGAALRVADMGSGIEQATELALNQRRQCDCAERALAFAVTHQGATAKTISALASYLPSKP